VYQSSVNSLVLAAEFTPGAEADQAHTDQNERRWFRYLWGYTSHRNDVIRSIKGKIGDIFVIQDGGELGRRYGLLIAGVGFKQFPGVDIAGFQQVELSFLEIVGKTQSR